MTNRTKDIVFLWLVTFVIIFTIFACGFWVGKSYAEPLTEQEQINKYYAEETVKNEMRYFAMWEYTENMTPEEYIETFFSKEK